MRSASIIQNLFHCERVTSEATKICDTLNPYNFKTNNRRIKKKNH